MPPLFFLFVNLSMFTQKGVATLYFKNGDKLEGLARMRDDGSIKFQNDKTSKACIYTHREISGLKFMETGFFHYKIIKRGHSV